MDNRKNVEECIIISHETGGMNQNARVFVKRRKGLKFVETTSHEKSRRRVIANRECSLLDVLEFNRRNRS